MLSNDDINELNKALAIAYTVNTLGILGYKKSMKEIDAHKNPFVRSYFRSLVNDAIEIMKEGDIPIKK